MAPFNLGSTRRRLIFATLLAIAVGAALVSTWNFETGLPSDSPARNESQTEEIPIPETPWGRNAPEVQRHVEESRKSLEEIKARHDASPIALANAYGQLGEIYLTYDLPPGAIACFRNASRLDPGNFRWPWLLAMAHYTAVETADAYAAMTEALHQLEQDYSAGPEHHLAARCFLGDAALRLNMMDEARRHFDEAIRLNPNSGFAHFRRGQLESRAGQSELSIQDFQDAMTQYSASGVVPGPVCLALAGEYQKLGRDADAAKYRRLAETGPADFVVSYLNPLMTRIRLLNQSSSYLRQAAELDVSRGNYPEALKKIATGLRGSPDSLKLRMLRVDILMRLGRTDEALAELGEVRRLDVHGSTGRAQLCELYSRNPATRSEALAEALRWQSEQPNSLRPRLTLAAIYFQMEQYQQARDILTTSAREYPQELSPQIGLATAICAMGDYAAAVAVYDELLPKFPENAELRHNLARFLVTCPTETLRDPARALKILAELIAEDNSFDLQETMACALAASGRMQEALKLIDSLTSPPGAPDTTSAQNRLEILRKSFVSGQPWQEKWPFAILDGSSRQ
ncbi:MAG: tetratricopeptide repeat protein [Planctomycetaceae bacterium]